MSEPRAGNPPPAPPREPGDTDMTATYVRVIAIWAAVLLALWSFSRYFS
jgi:hypothetical protein